MGLLCPDDPGEAVLRASTSRPEVDVFLTRRLRSMLKLHHPGPRAPNLLEVLEQQSRDWLAQVFDRDLDLGWGFSYQANRKRE